MGDLDEVAVGAARRAPRGEDADALAEIVRDPEVARWAGPIYLPPLAPADTRRLLDRQGPARIDWIVVDRSDGAVLGGANLFRIDHLQRNCWLGIALGPPARLGRGRGTETTRLITRFAFDWLGMEKVYLGVYDDNARAIAAYRRAGFSVEARLRRQCFIDGRLHDELWMAAHRPDPV